jgi:hypothetical protein
MGPWAVGPSSTEGPVDPGRHRQEESQMPPEPPPALATLMFAAGAVLPFLVVLACALLGLVKR